MLVINIIKDISRKDYFKTLVKYKKKKNAQSTEFRIMIKNLIFYLQSIFLRNIKKINKVQWAVLQLIVGVLVCKVLMSKIINFNTNFRFWYILPKIASPNPQFVEVNLAEWDVAKKEALPNIFLRRLFFFAFKIMENAWYFFGFFLFH